MLAYFPQADIVQVEGQTTRSAVLTSVSLIMAYETKDGSDVFTPAHLQRMCEMEAQWFQADDYTDYCPLDSKLVNTNVCFCSCLNAVHFLLFFDPKLLGT